MVKALLANSASWLASSAAAAAFALALESPADAQEKTLRGLLRENKDTAFGRGHAFSDIRSHRQFCARVPIRDYDQLAPWIARIRAGEQRVLSAEPVTRLVPTGGSTAGRKLIPYTVGMQRELNRAIGPWIFDMYRSEPAAMLGPSYWSVTPLADTSADVSEPSAVPIGFDADSD